MEQLPKQKTFVNCPIIGHINHWSNHLFHFTINII